MDILFTQEEIAEPVSLLHEYSHPRDDHHGSHAALWLCENGSHLTQSWFNQKIFTILNRDFRGHSPHTGGAIFFTGLGLSEMIIQAISHWSPAAWKIYIQENPRICTEQQLAIIQLHLPPP